jgi:hypothetical protein
MPINLILVWLALCFITSACGWDFSCGQKVARFHYRHHHHRTSLLMTLDSDVNKMIEKISMISMLGLCLLSSGIADPSPVTESASAATINLTPVTNSPSVVHVSQLKLPYKHVNVPLKDFLGTKATVVFNMKIDDPQTSQFSDLNEIYKKYKDEGLNMIAFPTEQGWFEPDDDEACRLKAKEYYGFGDYPRAIVTDKVSVVNWFDNAIHRLSGKAF